jgi:hypothetical protein
MDAIINYYRNLPRTMQITLWLAVGVFTPIVSIVFGMFFNGIGAMFSLLGFVLGLLNWKGVLFFAIVGIFFAGKAAINFIENYEVEEDVQEDNSWDPFR